MAYTKLFSSIIASSIWQENLVTKVVWITMLAIQNRAHVVEASVPGLAHLAGVSREDCEKALKKLMAPDPDSRNKAHDGRRIEVCPGGWLILNGEYYQQLMGAEDRKEKMRQYQRDCRERKKASNMLTITKADPLAPGGIPKDEYYDLSKGDVAPPRESYSDLNSQEVSY
jgi:hypothetical protein